MQQTRTTSSRPRVVAVEPAAHIGGDAARLTNRLLRLIPGREAERFDELTRAVDGLIGTKHSLFFHDMRITHGEALPQQPGAAFATEFWLPPDPEVGVLMVDMNVTEHWLETLLDDEPPAERRLSAVTAREFGLVTFVLLHVADALKQAGFPPLMLSTEPPPRSEPLAAVRDVERVAEVVFGVTSTRSAGLVRLFIPVGMVQSLESFSNQRSRTRAGFERLREAYPDLDVTLGLSLGFAMLTPSEADYLEAGDVILPTSHALEDDSVGDAESVVVLSSGHDADAGWCGSVSAADGGTWALEIDSFSQKKDAGMSENATEDDQTEMIEAANVRVEFGLGEVEMPLAELGELKPGYLLETDRQVGDGVDIIANGRKVATGELVSIDGKLGIRVMSVDH